MIEILCCKLGVITFSVWSRLNQCYAPVGAGLIFPDSIQQIAAAITAGNHSAL
jgi:hypothetical protein